MFSASIITTLFSYSKEDLDTSTEKLSSVMGKTLLTLKPAWALQDEAFISNISVILYLNPILALTVVFL